MRICYRHVISKNLKLSLSCDINDLIDDRANTEWGEKEISVLFWSFNRRNWHSRHWHFCLFLAKATMKRPNMRDEYRYKEVYFAIFLMGINYWIHYFFPFYTTVCIRAHNFSHKIAGIVVENGEYSSKFSPHHIAAWLVYNLIHYWLKSVCTGRFIDLVLILC